MNLIEMLKSESVRLCVYANLGMEDPRLGGSKSTNYKLVNGEVSSDIARQRLPALKAEQRVEHAISPGSLTRIGALAQIVFRQAITDGQLTEAALSISELIEQFKKSPAKHARTMTELYFYRALSYALLREYAKAKADLKQVQLKHIPEAEREKWAGALENNTASAEFLAQEDKASLTGKQLLKYLERYEQAGLDWALPMIRLNALEFGIRTFQKGGFANEAAGIIRIQHLFEMVQDVTPNVEKAVLLAYFKNNEDFSGIEDFAFFQEYEKQVNRLQQRGRKKVTSAVTSLVAGMTLLLGSVSTFVSSDADMNSFASDVAYEQIPGFVDSTAQARMPGFVGSVARATVPGFVGATA